MCVHAAQMLELVILAEAVGDGKRISLWKSSKLNYQTIPLAPTSSPFKFFLPNFLLDRYRCVICNTIRLYQPVQDIRLNK